MLKRALSYVWLAFCACASDQPASAFAPELSFGTPTRVIGTADGPGLVIGAIADVAVRGDGTLLVVDRSAATILHLSNEGEVLAQFGGRGEGPGEFQSPVRIALLPGDEYAVLDADRFHITRVRIDGQVHRYVGGISTPSQALTFCSARDDLVLNAVHGPHALVRLDLSGAVLGRFYELPEVVDRAAPESLQEELRDRLRLGAIKCLGSGQVLFASEWEPRVILFGADGEVRQMVEIAPHVRLEYEMTASGSARVVLPDEGWVDRAVSAHELEPGIVLTQFMQYGPGAGGRDDPPTEVRLIRLSDGAQVVFPDSLPTIVQVQGGMVWGWQNVPFPQVVLMPIEFSMN